MLGRKRLQHDVIIMFVYDGPRSLVDFEIFTKPSGNHDLPFDSEHHGVGFRCWIHDG